MTNQVWRGICAAAALFAIVAPPSRAADLADGAADTTQAHASAPPSLQSQTVFFDGTFNPGDWTTVPLQSLNDAGMTTSQQQFTTGGFPDRYFQFTGSLPSFNGNTSIRRDAHFSVNAVYDPALSGAITSMTAGFYQGSFVFTNDVVFETGVILRQNGAMYWPISNWAYGLQGAQGWYGSPTLYVMVPASGWALAAGSGPAHPDFSTRGTPIEFGFWTGYYFWHGGGTVTDGVDGWTVSITSTPVPEPAVSIILPATLGLLARNRRRSRGLL
jgi:hypothetical protein